MTRDETEKVARLGIPLTPRTLTYVRYDLAVMRINIPMMSPSTVIARPPPDVVREAGWIYYLDADGDISRKRRRRAPVDRLPPSRDVELPTGSIEDIKRRVAEAGVDLAREVRSMTNLELSIITRLVELELHERFKATEDKRLAMKAHHAMCEIVEAAWPKLKEGQS